MNIRRKCINKNTFTLTTSLSFQIFLSQKKTSEKFQYYFVQKIFAFFIVFLNPIIKFRKKATHTMGHRFEWQKQEIDPCCFADISHWLLEKPKSNRIYRIRTHLLIELKLSYTLIKRRLLEILKRLNSHFTILL